MSPLFATLTPSEESPLALTAIDLFCGAGGLTEGFRQAGFQCRYANDLDKYAIQTFTFNQPDAWADARPIEQVDARAVRRALGLKMGELSVITGGPPCQGFSINAPDRFLDNRPNTSFEYCARFLAEFAPKAFALEHERGEWNLRPDLVWKSGPFPYNQQSAN